MTSIRHLSRIKLYLLLGILVVLFSGSIASLFSKVPQKPAGKAPTDSMAVRTGESRIHRIHLNLPKGAMDCIECHIPTEPGSVQLMRPGAKAPDLHQACVKCHENTTQGTKGELSPDSPQLAFCQNCHMGKSLDTTDRGDLKPYPPHEKDLVILNEFSHKQHVDRRSRIDERTGFRKDCTFCHKFEPDGSKATIPQHAQCVVCHSKPDIKPHLAADSTSKDCISCHNPEVLEDPVMRQRRVARAVLGGVRRRGDLPFSHKQHFRDNANFGIQCTTCHYEILESRTVAELKLPKMWDCASCHDNPKRTPVASSMKNCSACHKDPPQGLAPKDHSTAVRPADHTELFRLRHAEAASAQTARCIFCHAQVSGISTAVSGTGGNTCAECHKISRPRSHTLRWKEELHGRMAALNREQCATCHTNDFCSRCHNLPPRTHQPLGFFRAGGHARLARLNERSCFTCHTFQNTCAECHNRVLSPP